MTRDKSVFGTEMQGRFRTVQRAICRAGALGTLVAATTLLASSAQAQTFTWQGGNSNVGWTFGPNWVGGVAPTPPGDLNTLVIDFNTTIGYASQVDANYSINALNFLAGGSGGTRISSNGSILTIGSGGITQASTASQQITAPLALGADQTWNLSGTGGLIVFSAVSGPGVLTKTGQGVLTLSGTNTFTGGFNIAGGQVNLGSGNNLADTLDVNLTGANTLLNLSANETIGSLASISSTTARISTGGRILTVGGNNASTTFGGVIFGTGGLTKNGTGTMALTGNNTFTGTLTVNAGTLLLGGSGNNLSDSSSLVVNGGTFALGAANESIFGLSGTGGTIATNGFILSVGGVGPSPSTSTYSGVITGSGGLTKNGSSTLILAGNNTFTGPLTINGGVLQLGGSGNNLADTVAVIVNSGGTFALGGANETIGSLTGTNFTSAVSLGSSTLTVGDATSTSFLGVISGTGGLVKQGSGTLTLSGNNTFTGGLTVNAGTLQLGGGGNLADTLAVTVNSGSTFALGTSDETIGSLDGNGGTVNLNSHVLFTGGNNASSTYAGTINGGGGLGGITKQGTGTFTLTGNYTGNTTISSGTLQIGNGGGTGSISGNVAVSGGANLTFNRTGALTYANVISGSGSVTKLGSGTLTLSGNNTFAGGLTVDAGTVQLGGSGNNLSDTGNVTVNTGGTLALGGANETIGSLSGSGGTVNTNNHILTTGGNNGSTLYAGTITGTGGINKAGTGTFILTGSNTYTGGTTVSGGTLQLGNGGTSGSITGNVALSSAGSTLAFNRTDNYTFNGVISGSGGVTKSGGGITTLTATNTYTGPTTVNAGTLNFTGSAASSAVTVNNGATLAGTSAAGNNVGDVTLSAGATLDPGDALSPSTTGTFRANQVTWDANGVWHFILKSSSAASDEVILSGALIKGAGAGTHLFDFSGTLASDIATAVSTPNNGNRYRYTLSTFGSQQNFTAADFSYTNFVQGYAGQFVLDPNNLYFDVYITPEPGTMGFLLVTGAPLGIMLYRRTRRNRKSDK